MTPPLILQSNHLQESDAANESTSTQIFGVMYITLTGLIDSMVPASGPWALLGKLLSYIVKLAPILWWALPAGPTGRPPASSQEPPTGWIPDTQGNWVLRSKAAKWHLTQEFFHWSRISNWLPVMNDTSILVLKTQELNPSPLKAD
ncbi:hypothetical protein DSO57_1019085 [Entomophthora muscae]|uniref:Uncharacterized protein n=1 Tax=Entomophthora muscae TaxID=34485 RepID=A0ACC2TFF3_9FUNG|nr:hypothetical protein DSO57_1019085 [Entomophthora muscae]